MNCKIAMIQIDAYPDDGSQFAHHSKKTQKCAKLTQKLGSFFSNINF